MRSWHRRAAASTARGWTEFGYRVSGDFRARSRSADRRRSDRPLDDRRDCRRRIVVAGPRRPRRARGKLGRGEAQDWSVSGRAADIDPSKLRKELPGRLAFDFRGAGSGFDENAPGPRASQNFRDSSAASARAAAAASGAAGPDGIPGRRARARAGAARGRRRDRPRRRISTPAFVSDDLSAFLPELGGRVNATLLVRERTLALGFTGHDLAYGPHRAVILSADAHIDRDGREHSWLRLRSNGITLGGFAVSDTRLSLDGLTKDHALTLSRRRRPGRRVAARPRRLGRMTATRCSSKTSPRAVRASCPGGSSRRAGSRRAARTPRSIRSASSTSRDASASKGAGRPGATGR